MAEAWLEEIYVHSKYVTKLKELIRNCQTGQKQESMRQWDVCREHLTEIRNNDSVADDQVKQWIQRILQLTPEVSHCSEIVDLIRMEIEPMMYYLISLYGKIDVSDGERQFLSSRSGYLTIRGEADSKFWYSTNDPMEEAYDIARRVHDPRNTEYHIWGGGLGYLAYQIYVLSQGTALIHVYEADKLMLDYGRHYGVLDWIAEEKLVLHHDPFAKDFLRNIDEEKLNYLVPRLDERCQQDERYKQLQRVHLNYRFWLEKKHSLKINLEKNLKSKGRPWKELENAGFEHTIVVAAGPSLDQCIEFLRQRSGKIIAVGTAFRKLLQLGIVPDLVVITDGIPLVYRQIEGLEGEQVPLLLSPYAYWKLAGNYVGEIYFAQAAPYLGENRLCSGDHKEQFQIGSTVSFFAMEAAARLGAKTVDLLGLDLAYPKEKSYAEGITYQSVKATDKFYEIPGNNGGMVYTDQVFDMFRQEIEGLIRQYPQVRFINHSAIGAKIRGTVQAGE